MVFCFVLCAVTLLSHSTSAAATASSSSSSSCNATMRFPGKCFSCKENTSNCTALGSVRVAKADDCCSACASKPGCNGWTFRSAVDHSNLNCFFKSWVTPDHAPPVPSACGHGQESGAMPPPPPPAPVPPTPPAPLPPPPKNGFKNVLFIIVDDLRPEIKAYGHDYMHTPNLDALAASATMFQRAYVQYSVRLVRVVEWLFLF